MHQGALPSQPSLHQMEQLFPAGPVWELCPLAYPSLLFTLLPEFPSTGASSQDPSLQGPLSVLFLQPSLSLFSGSKPALAFSILGNREVYVEEKEDKCTLRIEGNLG